MAKSEMPSSFEHHSHWYDSSLKSVSNSTEMLYTYDNVIHGYSTRLTPEEAEALENQPGTLSLLPEMRYELHTTRTPEFLRLGKSADMYPESNSASEVIIGVLDTGVWPESKSYDDTGLGPVHSNWKGICDSTKDEGTKAVAGEEEEEEGEVGSSLTLETLENIAISIDDEENNRNHFSSQSVLIVGHSEENDTQHNEVTEEIEIEGDTGESNQERQMISSTNALRLKSDGGIEDSSHINIQEDNDIHGHHEAQTRRNDDRNQKVTLEWIFVISNFCLEVISSVLDQLSSVHKPLYALLAMIFSFGGILICIVDLVFKGRTQKVSWRWKEKLPWLYYQSESRQLPFGTFKDIIGCVCALCQCIVTAINYIDDKKPIKISVWPIIFAFGQLCSKLLENP